MDNHIFIDSLEKSLKKVLLEAGEIAKQLQGKASIRYKSKNQPVTDADIKINNFLMNFFSKLTPEFGWLSEESEDNKSRFNSDYFWCLDPIDGTRSYIDGKPEYTISLALLKRTQPIIGMIVNPETKELFYAKKNNGAFCNDQKLSVNKKKKLNLCSFAISSSESKKLSEYNFLKNLTVTKMGSIAYKIALVAKGEVDVALSFTKKNDWDLAAADLILTESGGKIEEICGKKIIYNSADLKINSVLASNRFILSEFKNQINKREL